MESILLRRDGAIATFTLNRPAALNAFSPQVNLELSAVKSELDFDAAIRCIVLKGAGEHFMAGDDVKGIKEATSHMQWRRLDLERSIEETHSITTRLRRIPNL